MTVEQAIEQASSRIDRRDAETLLLHAVGRDRAWLWAHPEAELDAEQIAGFSAHVSRRAQHWPLQYLTLRQEFFGLDLCLSREVLIPRPETELLVEAVLRWIEQIPGARSPGRPLRIVDVGTGSGAISLALASVLPGAVILAVDLSPSARPVVELNASRLGLADQVTFVESDLLEAFAPDVRKGHRFDIVVSNPPYVPASEAASLQPEVRDFEPKLALFAGEDGLEVYRRLIPQAWGALHPGGLLALEFGFGQGDALMALLAPWREIRILEDYAGIPRIALATRPEAEV